MSESKTANATILLHLAEQAKETAQSAANIDVYAAGILKAIHEGGFGVVEAGGSDNRRVWIGLNFTNASNESILVDQRKSNRIAEEAMHRAVMKLADALPALVISELDKMYTERYVAAAEASAALAAELAKGRPANG